MEFVRYFVYYYALTRGRLIVFLILSLCAVAFELVALFAITSITSFGAFGDGVGGVNRWMLEALERIGFADEKGQFLFLMGFALIAFCTSSALFVWTVYYTAVVQSEIFVEMQRKMVSLLLDCDYPFFTTRNVGYLNNVIAIQIRQTSQSFKFYTSIVTAMLLSSIYLIVPLVTNPKLVAMMGITGLPMLWIVVCINRRTRRYSIESVSEQTRLNGILFQLVSHFKYLKSTETYPAVLERHVDFSGRIGTLMRKLSLLGALNEHGLMAYAVSFGILMVTWQFVAMNVPIVESVTILGLLFVAARKLSTVPSAYQKFLSVAGAITVCRELQRELQTNRDPAIDRHQDRAPDFSGPLVFQNVSYRYPGGTTDILRDISIEIPSRGSVAFVGGSGAGKSTLVNLITGLLRPTQGTISLSGVDYGDLRIRELRQGVGYVTQESVVFNDTVRNNVGLWQNLEPDGLEEAARRAHADTFIRELPNGYETLLGDNGINISGGQRQRITIARELLRNTPLLILDEATSALDTETERNIQSSIESCHGTKTLVIIAHRLSTVRNCDRIFVLEQGSVVEQGTYRELYARNGRFRAMIDSQTLGETAKRPDNAPAPTAEPEKG